MKGKEMTAKKSPDIIEKELTDAISNLVMQLSLKGWKFSVKVSDETDPNRHELSVLASKAKTY